MCCVHFLVDKIEQLLVDEVRVPLFLICLRLRFTHLLIELLSFLDGWVVVNVLQLVESVGLSQTFFVNFDR